MGQYVSEFTGPEIDNAIKNVAQGKAGIQGVKVNGTDITPDSATNKVDINVPIVSQTTGPSTTSVMSQSAVTTQLGNKVDSSSLSTVATSGTYTQTVSIPGILSTDTPIIDVSNPTQAMLDNWAYVSKIETSNDSITATCFSNQPTENINIKLMVVR